MLYYLPFPRRLTMYLLEVLLGLAGLVTQGGDTPRRHRVAARRRGALAAAVRVVDRVHGGAANAGPDAHPALAAGLAGDQVLVLGVADLADGGPALQTDHAHLAGGQAQDGVVALLGHDLGRRAGRAGDLPAAAFVHLDVVHHGTDRDVTQREGAAHADVGVGARFDHGAHAQLVGRQDVALVAVGVDDQRDAAVAVGIVLDRVDPAGNAVLVALEVDDPVQRACARRPDAGW